MTANNHTATTAAILNVIGNYPEAYSASVTTRKAARGSQAEKFIATYK